MEAMVGRVVASLLLLPVLEVDGPSPGEGGEAGSLIMFISLAAAE